ncbi:MAG: nuclear transport factor 2 family protein [Proteobacteria bacterium]|nr:nuclear transport factor 2 family protein [Pseudomonadota bacterium]
MTNPVTKELVDAFYDAFVKPDGEKLAALVHDDVRWTTRGPIEVLSFCGTHHGKAQVLELSTQILPKLFRDIRLVRESLVIDGDRAAALNFQTAQRCADGRVITYRFAHFFRFKDGKVIETTTIIDSFNAAEQVLGHALPTDGAVTQPGSDPNLLNDLVFL